MFQLNTLIVVEEVTWALTLIVTLLVAVAPLLSVTVSEAVKEPAE
jgi:hypothetical protein